MKKNQILVRDDPSFVTRTSDRYYNATILLDRWNELNPDNKKQLAQYKILNSTIEFNNLLIGEDVSSPIKSTRGKNGGTWMHPKMFIDFAMWVSVQLKSKVIDYVLDGLIQSRHDAGDYYNEMCGAILSTHVEYYGTKPNPKLYITEARRIRHLLGLDGKDRNTMSEKQLTAVTILQKVNAELLRGNVGKESRVKQLKFQAKIMLS